jgi:hypothetical protein
MWSVRKRNGRQRSNSLIQILLVLRHPSWPQRAIRRGAIPIHNVKGELIAYTGRWPGNTDKQKYLFPKGFRKSLELFNLDRVIKEADRVRDR